MLHVAADMYRVRYAWCMLHVAADMYRVRYAWCMLHVAADVIVFAMHGAS